MKNVGDWCLGGVTAAMWVFTASYGLRSRWWTNRVGRVFFPEKVIMCLLLLQVTVSVRTDSSYPGRDLVRIVLYGAGGAALVAMNIVLSWAQRRDREEVARQVAEDLARESRGDQ